MQICTSGSSTRAWNHQLWDHEIKGQGKAKMGHNNHFSRDILRTVWQILTIPGRHILRERPQCHNNPDATDQGHMRPKLEWETWWNQHSRPFGRVASLVEQSWSLVKVWSVIFTSLKLTPVNFWQWTQSGQLLKKCSLSYWPVYFVVLICLYSLQLYLFFEQFVFVIFYDKVQWYCKYWL